MSGSATAASCFPLTFPALSVWWDWRGGTFGMLFLWNLARHLRLLLHPGAFTVKLLPAGGFSWLCSRQKHPIITYVIFCTQRTYCNTATNNWPEFMKSFHDALVKGSVIIIEYYIMKNWVGSMQMMSYHCDIIWQELVSRVPPAQQALWALTWVEANDLDSSPLPPSPPALPAAPCLRHCPPCRICLLPQHSDLRPVYLSLRCDPTRSGLFVFLLCAGAPEAVQPGWEIRIP